MNLFYCVSIEETNSERNGRMKESEAQKRTYFNMLHGPMVTATECDHYRIINTVFHYLKYQNGKWTSRER